MASTRIVNIRRGEQYDVYVGRGSVWGNPFKIGVHGDRETVIRLYRERLMKRPELLARVPALKGKALACYCAPLPCHGDVLVELAEAA